MLGTVLLAVGLATAITALAESTGPDNPRLQVSVRSHGEEVKATSGSYHCIPGDEGQPDTCNDRTPEPLPLGGRVTVHGCGQAKIETGYRANRIKVKVESRKGEVLRSLGRAERLDETKELYGVNLPKLPRTSDRVHLFVHHTDGNDGDFEAGIARHANKC